MRWKTLSGKREGKKIETCVTEKGGGGGIALLKPSQTCTLYSERRGDPKVKTKGEEKTHCPR